MDHLEIWNECVAVAKKKLSGNSSGYQLIKGPVLKEAQRAYCAVMISK